MWFVVRQSPDLAPIMVRLLVEVGHGELGDKIAKVYPLNPPSAEHQMREHLKNGVAELRKLPKRLSLITRLLDHLNIERFEDVYRSAKQ